MAFFPTRFVPKGGIIVKMNEDRIINPNLENGGEEILENTIRPQTLDEYIGKDKVKENTKKSIEELNKLGITTRIFTGDTKQTAEEIAKQAGIREVKSQMLPQDKFKELEKIIEQNEKGKKVAFVGDGINDSPVLARADIGISMGGVGAQSAIEASDVVLMTDEITKIIEGIKISKKTNKIIKQNLLFSIGIKIIILALSILGLSNMWQAVFSDVGVTIITILNTLRILK